MKMLQNIKNAVKQALKKPITVSGASSDVGKCTTCRFNDKKWDRCTAGSYWAAQGLKKICYEGELWEAQPSQNLTEL